MTTASDSRYCSTKVYEVHVHNSGPIAGAEVDQLYVSPIADSLQPVGRGTWTAPLPKRKLLDFEKVSIGAGESKIVSFTVIVEKHLRLTDLDGTQKVVPGSYRLTFTNGADQSLHDLFIVKG